MRKKRKSDAKVIDDVITMTPVADDMIVETPSVLLGINEVFDSIESEKTNPFTFFHEYNCKEFKVVIVLLTEYQ